MAVEFLQFTALLLLIAQKRVLAAVDATVEFRLRFANQNYVFSVCPELPSLAGKFLRIFGFILGSAKNELALHLFHQILLPYAKLKVIFLFINLDNESGLSFFLLYQTNALPDMFRIKRNLLANLVLVLTLLQRLSPPHCRLVEPEFIVVDLKLKLEGVSEPKEAAFR